jgi:AAA family ATPase
LDREIEISVPSPDARLDILQKLLSKMPHEITEEELKNVANSAHGFVGADLASLCSRAAVHAVKRTHAGEGVCGSGSVTAEVEDLLWAMTQVKPSAMREVLIEVPNVRKIHVKNIRKKLTFFFVCVCLYFCWTASVV